MGGIVLYGYATTPNLLGLPKKIHETKNGVGWWGQMEPHQVSGEGKNPQKAPQLPRLRP